MDSALFTLAIPMICPPPSCGCPPPALDSCSVPRFPPVLPCCCGGTNPAVLFACGFAAVDDEEPPRPGLFVLGFSPGFGAGILISASPACTSRQLSSPVVGSLYRLRRKRI